MGLQALWMTFSPDPHVANMSSLQLFKINQQLSPSDVILNGSQSLHAVTDEGVIMTGLGQNDWEQLQILYV